MKHSPLLLLLSFFLVYCNPNDAQQEFERQAYAAAANITPTDFNGNTTGETDDDDWRISPFYAGLARINPLFPNPVPYGNTGTLEIFMNGTPYTTVLVLGFIDIRNEWVQVAFQDDVTDFSQNTLLVNPEIFGSNVDNARGTYRLILLDGNQRVITYGDVIIE
jgi:hypothetical protein